MSQIYDVRHLNLTYKGEPVCEYEPMNADGQHVVTLFRGHLTNCWHVLDLPQSTRDALNLYVAPVSS